MSPLRHSLHTWLMWLLWSLLSFTTSAHVLDHLTFPNVTTGIEIAFTRNSLATPSPLATIQAGLSADVASARQALASATPSIGLSNLLLRQNPRRNQYSQRSGSQGWKAPNVILVESPVVQAAAIVAQADVLAGAFNTTSSPSLVLPSSFPLPPGHDLLGTRSINKRDSTFWLETVGSNSPGSDPFGSDESYVVWRNVLDYGAYGDGKHDDTQAINKAIADGNRCGGGTCDTTSVKPAVIYFPAGTYLVSSPIVAYFNTQLIGNPKDLPVIRAAPAFAGLGVMSSDVYTGSDGGSGEWYLDTANFYRAVRNFVIDIRSVNTKGVACVHWQVAQASSLENMFLYMVPDADKAQVGVFAENGSGGFMADLYFIEGSVGLQCGNQQFTTRNLNFYSCATAVSLLWDWGWTFKSLHIYNANTGINITKGTDIGGSVYILDSSIQGTSIGIEMADDQNFFKTNYVNIQNLALDNVQTGVSFGSSSLVAGSSGYSTIASWVYGTTYSSNIDYGNGGLTVGSVENMKVNGTSLANGAGSYFERSRPQYIEYSSSNFINAKSYAYGDGKHDDTFALNAIFADAARSGSVVYMPAGVYIVTDTVYVPPGTRIVGSCWSQIMASGSKFQNQASPHPMVQVGRPGDVGLVEIQDVLFTVRGPTAGAVLVEWNLKASSTGAAAMWDSHYRVGGAIGTNLSAEDCPILTGKIDWNCVASTLMLHLTNTSNAYIENSWAWVADHDLDNQNLTQVNIYGARGVLIESKGPTWLYGTASEHSLLYQYQLNAAENIFMGMIQTESPYYSPAPAAPGPFAYQIGLFDADPDFASLCQFDNSTGCPAAWALSVVNSSNITVGGAGLYSWFIDYDEACVNTQNCQESLVNTESNQDIYIRNLYTIGATNMIVPQDSIMDITYAANNTNEESHPFLAVIAAWTDTDGDELAGDDSCGFDDDRPECLVQPDWYCNPSLTFASLDALSAASSNISSFCIEIYAMQVVYDMLGAALTNYSTVDHGYDSVWGDYVQSIREQVPLVLSNYTEATAGPINKWFDCTFQNDITDKNETTRPCPLDASYLSQRFYTVYYTLRPGLEANYTNDLLENYGIETNWTKPGSNVVSNDHCNQSKDSSTCTTYRRVFQGIPVAATNYTVPNPKDVVERILPNVTVVQTSFLATQLDVINGFWAGSNDDILQAMSTAVFLFVQAVDNMAQVKAIGEAQKAADKRALIVKILTIVCSVLPFLGDIGEIAAPLTQLGRIVALFSLGVDDGLTILSIVSDPTSAPLAILGLLLQGPGFRDPEDFAEMGAARRAMTADEVTKVGEDFEKLSDDLDHIVSACTI